MIKISNIPLQQMDYKKFVEGSRNFLKNYITNNHPKSLIIGVSGGIDSTVSCAIASPVCEELNIPLIGRSLPTTTNKIEESEIAQQVGNAFCSDFKTVNISDECEMIIHNMELTEGKMTNLQKGNIKARYRMVYLRNLASIHKGVVLDNDNFTEWNLGFWTIGGDSPMDVNLGLHYLWKTEVYELAHYLYNETLENRIPTKQSAAIMESMALVPTDGNGVSSSDCEQFGLDNYNQVDDILKTVYHTTYTVGSKEAKDTYTRLINYYNKQGFDKVIMLHQNTAYKRKSSPIMPTKQELGL